MFISCSGLTPAGRYTNIQTLAHFLPVGGGRDLELEKRGKKLMGLDQDSLIKKEKETSDKKAIAHHQQTDAQAVSEQWRLWRNFPQFYC